MRSFFAMIWNAEDAACSASASSIRLRIRDTVRCPPAGIEGTGFALFDLSKIQTGLSLVPFGSPRAMGQGAVFGTLFRRDSRLGASIPVPRLREDEAALITKTVGRSLLGTHWGSYVALFQSPTGFHVLQDPTSAIPCYFAQRGGLTFVFSNLERCTFLDRSWMTINWNFISGLLAYDKLLNGETGLNEVRELLAGERLDCFPNGRTKVTPLWDPRIVAHDVIEPAPAEAASLLAETVQHVVNVRAACFDNITVSLSGGLDSSIVLGSLARGDYTGGLNAAHYLLGSGDAPERAYAEAAAKHAGCEIISIETRPEDGFPEVAACPASARPLRQFLAPDLPGLLPGNLNKAGAAWFSGQGGDHLFLVSRSPALFSDYLKRHGWSLQTASVLLDAAHLSGMSIWSVLRQTLMARSDHPTAMVAGLRGRRTLLNRAHHERLDPSKGLPAWAQEPGGLPPAKFDQVSILPHLFQLRDPLGSASLLETVHPLISQPLLELCLRLPTYLLNTGGTSRGLARRAFAGVIPDMVRLRMTKGYASRFYGDRVAAHRDQIDATLKGGELTKRGLVSEADLDTFIRTDRFRSDQSGSMILVYYGIEAWLRTWAKIQAEPS